MPDRSSPESKTLDDLAERPQIASDDDGGGVGSTLGQDVGAADERADQAARRTLKAQMDNAHRAPRDGEARGGTPSAQRTPIVPDLSVPGPTPTPGAPVPPATTDLHNSDE